MPLMKCQEGGKSGWKYGDSGKCYTHEPGDKAGEATAKLKASKQGVAEKLNGSKE